MPRGESASVGAHAGVAKSNMPSAIKGRKRRIVTDTLGHLVGLVVHGADIQDRDGAVEVLSSIRHRYPWLRHVFADGGYGGEKLKGRLTRIGSLTLQIVKRSDHAGGFEVLPKLFRPSRPASARTTSRPPDMNRCKEKML
jgi:hypothetical protein